MAEEHNHAHIVAASKEMIEDLQADLNEFGDEEVYAVYGDEDHSQFIVDYISVNPIAGITTPEQLAEVEADLDEESLAMLEQHTELIKTVLASTTNKQMLASELVTLLEGQLA